MSSLNGANCVWISIFKLICGLYLASSAAMAGKSMLSVAQAAVLQGKPFAAAHDPIVLEVRCQGMGRENLGQSQRGRPDRTPDSHNRP